VGVFLRAVRYYAVGFGGAALQTGLLALCVHLVGLDYRPSMLIALFLTLVHNFAWHAGWTWSDRRLGGVALAGAFAQFISSNGLVSLLSTVVMMPLLVDGMRMDPVVATIVTIGSGGLVNFWLATLIFAPKVRRFNRGRSGGVSDESVPDFRWRNLAGVRASGEAMPDRGDDAVDAVAERTWNPQQPAGQVPRKPQPPRDAEAGRRSQIDLPVLNQHHAPRHFAGESV
jgi:putative flippase GtrA